MKKVLDGLMVIYAACTLSGYAAAALSGLGNTEESGENTLQSGLKKRAEAALAKARKSMLAEEQVYMDVLWVITQFVGDDPELLTFIKEKKSSAVNPSYVPGVFPEKSRIELPKHPGIGTKKLFTYVQAAFGQPEERAVAFIQDYIAADAAGYALTHQFLSLIWAEQGGLSLSNQMLQRKEELWRKIYNEQCAVEEVDSTDLYMERVAIVLVYGRQEDVSLSRISEWIHRIIALQLEDGSWPPAKTRVYFDGASTVINSPRPHTTALAMMALDGYLSVGWCKGEAQTLHCSLPKHND